MKGEVDLWIGNGAKVATLEQGDYELILPSGLVILLRNCYYVPAMSRNIISISCLDLDSYSFFIENNKITIHRNDIYYGNAILDNGLYILDLNNNKSIYKLISKGLNQMS